MTRHIDVAGQVQNLTVTRIDHLCTKATDVSAMSPIALTCRGGQNTAAGTAPSLH